MKCFYRLSTFRKSLYKIRAGNFSPPSKNISHKEEELETCLPFLHPPPLKKKKKASTVAGRAPRGEGSGFWFSGFPRNGYQATRVHGGAGFWFQSPTGPNTKNPAVKVTIPYTQLTIFRQQTDTAKDQTGKYWNQVPVCSTVVHYGFDRRKLIKQRWYHTIKRFVQSKKNSCRPPSELCIDVAIVNPKVSC